jgi:hypothetical protein
MPKFCQRQLLGHPSLCSGDTDLYEEILLEETAISAISLKRERNSHDVSTHTKSTNRCPDYNEFGEEVVPFALADHVRFPSVAAEGTHPT